MHRGTSPNGVSVYLRKVWIYRAKSSSWTVMHLLVGADDPHLLRLAYFERDQTGSGWWPGAEGWTSTRAAACRDLSHASSFCRILKARHASSWGMQCRFALSNLYSDLRLLLSVDSAVLSLTDGRMVQRNATCFTTLGERMSRNGLSLGFHPPSCAPSVTAISIPATPTPGFLWSMSRWTRIPLRM